MAAPTEPIVDGRRARKDRGRAAVTDATLDLVFEGNIPPSPEQIAARSGVSVASIFRYFDTLDDLRRSTAEVYLERYGDLFEVPSIGDGSLPTRVDNFVSSRVSMHETTEPMARLVRWRAPDHLDLSKALQGIRHERAQQVRRHFALEFGRLTPAVADDLVTVITTMTSFESWDQARHDHDRTALQLRRAWSRSITELLTHV